MRLVPLLIASLLLHLAFIIAVINSGREEAGFHHISTDMAVEYVAGGGKDGKRQEIVPLPRNLQPEPMSTILPGAKTAVVQLPEEISAAERALPQTAPVSGSPSSITAGSTANAALRSGSVR